MPAKKTSSKPRGKKAPAEPTKKAADAFGPNREPKSRQGIRIPDAIRAQMWALREEGQTIREIARSCGVAVRSVTNVFSEDPARYATLCRAIRDERAAVWQQIETTGLQSLVQVMGAARAALLTEGGEARESLSEAERVLLELGPRWASIFRQAADSGTRQSQTLAGMGADWLPAEGVAALELGDDTLIQQAIELGLEDRLPASMRARASKQSEDAV